ncbi:unnamed protein product [Acanthoscelides obtectus]|uniref:C2H2-type domain-containing protein n=2 Tax=Acanthoscelides obtectus TaxID=200917 RepID=A0A9P0KMA5_ACAOB|nr:unnamed protein product [Acanthoscelides obtectus]CAK1657762.1 Testis-specific zinc finger protein topi [Acanthoscelides obtectus]
MNSLEAIVINVYKLTEKGKVVFAIKHEFHPVTKEIISRRYFTTENLTFELFDDDKLNLNCYRFPLGDNLVKFIKLEESLDVPVVKCMFNISMEIICQNCERVFSTKYQYQRHQCEFNAEKVILKPDTDLKETEQTVREKYICDVCNRQFASRSNLERHHVSHENVENNVCEHCKKQFVSENRLKTHKENHCKKAGDLSKFYRSDVVIWKCKTCHEVFSSEVTAKYHVSICTEMVEISSENNDGSSNKENEPPAQKEKCGANVEKMLTEILLQCEFCNRTYADKTLLLMHQRKHTTAKNYECVNCSQIFESYATAAQHWMKKCSEYVSLFYLPKLTYCEYCDRTFKSHELLYTHKIKKKHYTSKLHNPTSSEEVEEVVAKKEKFNENKEVLNKLIEDVLKTLNVPINTIGNTISSIAHEDIKNEPLDLSNKENEIKVGEKKKRGRKRKWPKEDVKMKIFSGEVDEGFKYQCERCIKVFGNIADLESHRDKQHAASFTCDECGQVLHSAKALLIHSRAHKSLKPYVCETCGRSYSQTSHLWQHMRFHQGIKPFACPHECCEARYTIRPDLKDHIRKVHTRERPFKCNVCDKCFLTGSVYYQHRLIHTNDRRYACDVMTA